MEERAFLLGFIALGALARGAVLYSCICKPAQGLGERNLHLHAIELLLVLAVMA